jgi:hypothetical protein
MNATANLLEKPSEFDWPLADEAESKLRHFLQLFLENHSFARRLSDRLSRETGTDFYEWVDHLTLDPEHLPDLLAAGLEPEHVDSPVETTVLHHPKAMMPRVLLTAGGSVEDKPRTVAVRPESIVDLVARLDCSPDISGALGSRVRTALLLEEKDARLIGIERLACRDFVDQDDLAVSPAAFTAVRQLWRTRRRNFRENEAGVEEAFAVQETAFALVGRDIACETFFTEERAFWELRNRAGRWQKHRQDLLGFGWGNHDHHTFRSSRESFVDLIRFLMNFGFEKRERYYAGAQAGWGAQILEHALTGITVFADVDLMPGETEIDFSEHPLPPASKLGTVGLWCALHGDSFLQAGMHHLEARFDFARVRDQWAEQGIGTMKPFSDFPFLKQAFTEGERWPVAPFRLQDLLSKGLISQDQASKFAKEGAIGSHLENLQRKGGFKGFNQKSVSVIIAATDPRQVVAT